jgi:hypothetical protein
MTFSLSFVAIVAHRDTIIWMVEVLFAAVGLSLIRHRISKTGAE